MNILESILDYFRRKQSQTETPEGLCPNCWGKQEYEGKFLEASRKENIDLNNINEKTGWINAYAVEHFEGIKLREEDGAMVCPACKSAYRPG